MKKIVGFVAAWLSFGQAMAQTPTTYQLTDSALSIHQIHSFTCLTSQLCQVIVPIDFTGNPFGVSGNPFYVAPASGATFPVSGSVAITGTLPAFAATPTFNCGSGCASGGGVVTNAGAFAVQLTGATNNLNNISGTISLPTGAATQTTLASVLANQATNAATTVHTCATSGYSELGCLGQLDDDIKAGTGTIAATLPTQALLTGMKDGLTGLLSPVIGDAATGQWVNLTTIGGTITTGMVTAASTATIATQVALASNESPNSQLSVTTGTTADAACSTDNGTCTLPALIKRNNQNITTLNATAAAPAQLAVNVTPTDCSGTVTTGGTAVNAFTAQTTLHGFTILNDDTSEPLWISFTTTAAASTAGSYPLAAATATSFANASSYTTPPGFGTNHALSVVAATTAHKFSCTWW